MGVILKLGSTLTILVVMILSSPCSQAQQVDPQRRIDRLEATVEELAYKLAKALAENKRMEAALKDAISATRRDKVVVSGCEVASFVKARAYDNWDGSGGRSWIKRNASSCTRTQLLELRKLSNKLNSYVSSYLSVIDYELSNR